FERRAHRPWALTLELDLRRPFDGVAVGRRTITTPLPCPGSARGPNEGQGQEHGPAPAVRKGNLWRHAAPLGRPVIPPRPHAGAPGPVAPSPCPGMLARALAPAPAPPNPPPIPPKPPGPPYPEPSPG